MPNITLLNENVLVKDLSNTNLLPLAAVNLKCKYVNGNVKIAVLDKELPLNNVHILLGNDLAGQLPLPNLVVFNTPIAEQHYDV